MSAALMTVLSAVGLALVTGSPDLLRPRLESRETYAETFTFVADLGAEGYVQAQILISNLGLGDGNGACRLLVVAPGAAATTRSAKTNRAGWRWHGLPTPELQVGRCRIRGGARTSVDFEIDDMVAALDFDGGLGAVRPPASRVEAGDGYWENEVFIRSARVQGVLGAAGRERPVSGWGFADHSRATAKPWDVAGSWVRFRALGPTPLLLQARRSTAGSTDGWIWRPESDAPTPMDGAHWHGALERWQARAGEWEITSTEPLFRFAPADEYGALGALMRPFVGRPVTLTMRAVARRAGEPAVQGIMEVSLADEKR